MVTGFGVGTMDESRSRWSTNQTAGFWERVDGKVSARYDGTDGKASSCGWTDHHIGRMRVHGAN